MAHVTDCALRRLVDEPLAVSDADTHHLGACRRCQARSRQIVENAGVARGLLSPPRLVPDTDEAWASLARRMGEAHPPRPSKVRIPRHRRWQLMGASLSTGATLATVGVVLTGVAAATTFSTVFAPTKVAPVQVNRGDIQALADLAGLGDNSALGGLVGPSGSKHLRFGDLSWSSAGKAASVTTLSEAAAATGMQLSLPSTLPAGVGAPSSFVVEGAVTAHFTLSRGSGPDLAGSTLSVTLGPAVLVQYGSAPGAAKAPTLAILTMQRPTATSTGATTAQLESFLLSQPGVPADLAQEIRLLGNLGSTLPVPTPPGAVETSTEIAGSPAVVLTDFSGLVSGVIWEDHAGLVHVVAGLLDTKDVVNVANQLG